MGCNQCKDEIKLPKNDKGCATPGVIQIENAGEIITFHTVQISAAQGDEEGTFICIIQMVSQYS